VTKQTIMSVDSLVSSVCRPTGYRSRQNFEHNPTFFACSNLSSQLQHYYWFTITI